MTAETTDSDPTAVMVRRAFAHLIDTAVYAAALAVPALLFVQSRDFAPGETLDRIGQADNGDLIGYSGGTVYTLTESDLAVAAAIAVGVFLLVAVVLQGLTGGTIGKFVTGVRTVRPNGGRPGIFRALVRSLLWIIDGIPSFAIPLVGGLVALITTGRRRVGDLVARTYVVDRHATGTPIVEADEGRAVSGDDVSPEAEVQTTPELADHPGHVTITGADEPAAAVTDDRMASESAWAGDDAPPVAEPEPGATVAAEEPATPTTSGDKPTEPKWDPQRKAYISYDPRRGGWMQHDTESGEWVPISTA